VRSIEAVLGMVRDGTGDDESAARLFRAVGYYLAGAAIDETAGYAKGPSAAEPVSNEYTEKECPLLFRCAKYFQRPEWGKTFELGLEALFAAGGQAPRNRGMLKVPSPPRASRKPRR
jgi:hypothetical protein